MTEKKSNNNPWHNEAFSKQSEPVETDKKQQAGEKFIKEELESEIEDIEKIKDEIAEAEKEVQSIKELKDEIEGLKTVLKESQDKLLRAHAEIENVRYRTRQDVEKAHKFALEDFSKSLFPVIDSLERALEISANDGQSKSMKEGIELTLKMFLTALEKSGVKQTNPLNEIFDPKIHEAISVQQNADLKPNTVIKVLQKGFLLYGRVLRPALVIVSKV